MTERERKYAREYARRWKAVNPERLRANRRRYYGKNREAILERQRAQRKNHPERQRATNKKKRLKAVYGITLEQYNEMIARQGNRCAICDRPPGKNPLSVDHDHATKRVRGGLCARCNRGIGLFWDNPEILAKAAAYLR
jgi:hypothetical protein